MKTRQKIEFGDFQTPASLAREVCELLRKLNITPDTIIEPTCGEGSFMEAAADFFPAARLEGFEINAEHLEAARGRFAGSVVESRAVLHQQDFFAFDWDAYVAKRTDSLLFLGNLPWVTNSAVAALNGGNVPKKQNFQGLRGFAAKTGKSNFDISEWMLIRLIQALRGKSGALAILCKTATACKVLRYAWQNDGRIASASLYRIAADKHFNAAVDACLFIAWLGHDGTPEARLFDSLNATIPERRVGLAGRDLVADLTTYENLKRLEGLCPYQWRSGVKHDCSSVMELEPVGPGHYRNKLEETVALEDEFVYPLLKSTDLSKGRQSPTRAVLVTQQHPGGDTTLIAERAPLTWSYLQQHRDALAARKSSIYAKSGQFAIFGVGDYSFVPWKVATSALHHALRFTVVPPHEGRPVMFDDTCNFLSFSNEGEAHVVARILNSTHCLEFLRCLIFPGAKRPLTIELLQRLNISAIAEDAGLAVEWREVRRVTYADAVHTAEPQLVMEPSPNRAKTR